MIAKKKNFSSNLFNMHKHTFFSNFMAFTGYQGSIHDKNFSKF